MGPSPAFSEARTTLKPATKGPSKTTLVPATKVSRDIVDLSGGAQSGASLLRSLRVAAKPVRKAPSRSGAVDGDPNAGPQADAVVVKPDVTMPVAPTAETNAGKMPPLENPSALTSEITEIDTNALIPKGKEFPRAIRSLSRDIRII